MLGARQHAKTWAMTLNSSGMAFHQILGGVYIMPFQAYQMFSPENLDIFLMFTIGEGYSVKTIQAMGRLS